MWQSCISCFGSTVGRDDGGDHHDDHRHGHRHGHGGDPSSHVCGHHRADHRADQSTDHRADASGKRSIGTDIGDSPPARPTHAGRPEAPAPGGAFEAAPGSRSWPEGQDPADLATPISPRVHPPDPPPHARAAMQPLAPTATIHHPRMKITAAAFFRASFRLPSSLRAPAQRAPKLDIRDVDLSHWTPSQVEAQTPSDRAAMAARCERLHLPDGCPAEVIRLWLRASPRLCDLTAANIDDDGEFLSALHSMHLRFFRTTPPGPRALSIGLQSQVVMPRDRVTPPDRARLQGWVEQPETLPLLSADDFIRLRRVLDRYLFEPASRLRQGVWLVGGVRRAMLDLMEAAPSELLTGVAAQNYHGVLARVSTPPQQRMFYGEFLHFLRPTLLACWRVVAVPREPSGHAQRPREDLWRGAVLRHWVLSAPEGESVGERERIAASLVEAGRLQHSETLRSLLLSPAPLLDDDSQQGSLPGTASQPTSPASPVSPSSPASEASAASHADDGEAKSLCRRQALRP